jgi:HlyD family secretion protein
MSLFRKKALDALSTPEQLDQPLQLLRPGYWTLLCALLAFGVYLLFWSILGRLPVRIKGKGVLTTPNTMHLIQAQTSGRVRELSGELGMCVQKGDTLALIEPVRLQLEKKKAEGELSLLIDDDNTEELYADKRLVLKKTELQRVNSLQSNGAISTDDLSRRYQDLRALESQLLAEDNRRDQTIQKQKLTIDNLRDEIDQTALIKATIDGCLSGRLVQNGQMVQTGTTLFELDTRNSSAIISSHAFFPAKDGKRLKIGQLVRVTPTTTKPQRHGGIQGTITSISSLPVSHDSLKLRIGDEATVKNVSQHQSSNGSSSPLIEVTTSLKKDNSTISGYDWGGGNGPDLQLTSGTTTNVSVIVEERSPISYVIPILRDLSGIY